MSTYVYYELSANICQICKNTHNTNCPNAVITKALKAVNIIFSDTEFVGFPYLPTLFPHPARGALKVPDK